MNTLIAAIEFGSSRISAIAGQRNDQGGITISAIESEPADGCVKHGYINNSDEAAAIVKHLIQKLNNRLRTQKIGKVYVSVGGQSLHSMMHTPMLHIGENGMVIESTILHLKKISQEITLQGYDVLAVLPIDYNIDGMDYDNPLNITGNDIIGRHLLIVGRSSIKRNIKTTINKAGISIAGFITQPLATATILNNNEKEKGCILIDFGASNTIVQIYKGCLRHLAVIPLGSDTVTNDISSVGIHHKEAEEAKTHWSSAFSSDSNNPKPSAMDEKAIGMDLTTLNNIVQCRYEEIIANIKHQIELSGIDKQELESGCIITGGASIQKGLISLLGKQLDMTNLRVRANSTYEHMQTEKKPRYATLLGLIGFCTANCEVQSSPMNSVNANANGFNRTATTTVAQPQTTGVQQPASTSNANNANVNTQNASTGNQTAVGNNSVGNNTGNNNATTKDQNDHKEEIIAEQSKKRKPLMKRFIEDLFSGMDD